MVFFLLQLLKLVDIKKLQSLRFPLLLINQRLDSTAYIWLLKWIMKTSSHTWRLIKTSLLHNTWSSLAEFVGALFGSTPNRQDAWKWIVERWQSGEWHFEVSEVCSLLLAIWVVVLNTHWQLRYSTVTAVCSGPFGAFGLQIYLVFTPIPKYRLMAWAHHVFKYADSATLWQPKPLTTAVQSRGHSMEQLSAWFCKWRRLEISLEPGKTRGQK